MSGIDEIYKKIHIKGGRITVLRQNIIEIILKRDCIISHKNLLAELDKKGFCPNRSTIFRELNFLTTNNIIKGFSLNGIEYYEIPKSHHHHLICYKCNSIIKIEMNNNLSKQEKIIAKKTGFRVLEHSLDFYGYCPTCLSLLN